MYRHSDGGIGLPVNAEAPIFPLAEVPAAVRS
jgi:hypothetical protein